ncbi:phosphoribosylanthranilate isomerase [Marinicrinis sediminis]|uniref:N-(5'-phosphoribosyl)anthranilate isomerase n=1 Tax=Marinicrinis sediminis TaxID=1652465 RepID=A0ABW5RE00_9BACL
MRKDRTPATAVKICGFKELEHVKQAAKLGITQMGFIFAPSKRQVEAEFVRRASLELDQLVEQDASQGEHTKPELVGVFVNPAMDELKQVMREIQLDVIQLHGQESPSFCQSCKTAFKAKVWKVFSLKRSEDSAEEQTELRPITVLKPYAGLIDAVLLDTHDPVYGGGSGKSFNWEIIPEWKEAAEQIGVPLYVAGGLDAENVVELLDTYAPHGVDISSGVESNGVKDNMKMTAFMERVRSIATSS